MINLEVINKAKLETSPFTHAEINNIIAKDVAKKLITELPNNNEKSSIRRWGSDKVYRVKNNIVYDLKTGALPTTKLWSDLINSLSGKEYKLAVERLLNLDLSDSVQEITFKRYFHGDHISAHTDRNFSIATHLFFFNEEWESDWGGCLQLLDNDLKVEKNLLPLSSNSLLFIRSDSSWHCVSKCTKPDKVRFSLQVVFCKSNSKIELPGREEEKNYGY